jgi:phosphinothricin acetyltransferase
MRIRLATPSDGPRLAEIYAPAVAGMLSVELTPPDGAEMSRRITETLPLKPWLVAEEDIILGFSYAGPHRVRPGYAWTAESTIYNAPEVHRRGVGRALYTSLFAILVLQGFQNVFAGLTIPNPPSRHFHLAMGYEPVGIYRKVAFKRGQWLDLEWFGRSLGPHPSDPPPPRLLPALVGTPEFARALTAGEA